MAEAKIKGIPFVLFDFNPNTKEHQSVSPTLDRRQGADLEFFKHPYSRVRLPDEPRNLRGDFEDIIERIDENMNDERFKKYVLLFEEGEEFYDLPAFLKLIAKGRKFFLQVVTVSPQAAPFAEICRPMRPKPE